MKYKAISRCRSCGSSLESKTILDLGTHKLPDWLPSMDDSHVPEAPLELVLCESHYCRLLQLRHSVDPDLLYREYFYASGTNETMIKALRDVVDKAVAKVDFQFGDVVVDIGSNDGTLLRCYPGDAVCIGFDPSDIAQKAAIMDDRYILVNDYFDRAGFQALGQKQARIVTACAMLYDLEKPLDFLSDVYDILEDDGVFVAQVAYLPLMLLQNDFMNVGHEHLEYYSLRSLEYALHLAGLTTFDAEVNNTNGGSLRIYASKDSRPASPMLIALRRWEDTLELNRTETYRKFRFRVEGIRRVLVDLVTGINQGGERVYGYAASTKGNVLLGYCGFDLWDIPAISDRNPRKWGTFTAGTRIPVISEEQARKDAPDYFLVLAWAFFDEFQKREAAWKAAGGRWILPLPEVRIE